MTPKEHKQVLELIKTVSDEFKSNLKDEVRPLKEDISIIQKDTESIKLWIATQKGKQTSSKTWFTVLAALTMAALAYAALFK